MTIIRHPLLIFVKLQYLCQFWVVEDKRWRVGIVLPRGVRFLPSGKGQEQLQEKNVEGKQTVRPLALPTKAAKHFINSLNDSQDKYLFDTKHIYIVPNHNRISLPVASVW